MPRYPAILLGSICCCIYFYAVGAMIESWEGLGIFIFVLVASAFSLIWTIVHIMDDENESL